MARSRRKTLLALVIAAVGVAAACHANPDIDGAGVPTVGSPSDAPTCVQVCARLAALCGYAPVDCTTSAADGYCDLNLTGGERSCIGDGTVTVDGGPVSETHSCQAAWDCVAFAPPSGDASTDGATDASGTGYAR